MLHPLPIALFCCTAAMAQGWSSPTTIAVVDAATGRPCGGAQVWIAGADHPAYQTPRDPAASARERLVRHGRALRCDAQGEVAVPEDLQADGLAEAGALVGERWSARSLPWPPRLRLVLVVDDDPVLTVHLLGPDDRPLGLGVFASLLPGGHASAPTLRQDADAARGTLQLRPAALREAARRSPSHDGQLADEGLLQLTLDAVTSAPVRTTFDLHRPLPADVTLRAPAFGSLRVRVTDADGKPIAQGHAHAAAIDPATGQRILHGAYQAIRGGEAFFPAVALGLQVQLQVNEEIGPPTLAKVAGPTKAGEEVLQAVELGKARRDGKVVHEISGRLLDPEGQPMPDRLVHVQAEARTSGSQPVRASGTSDAAGRFVVRLLGPFTADTELVLAVAASVRPGQGRVDHFASRPLQPTQPGSALGDVRVGPAPLLVAGRVVDTRGKPVHASLEVRREGHPDADAPALPGTLQTTDRDGGFAAHASFATGKTLRVRCQPSLGGPAIECTVAPGSRDVIVTVPALTAVSGRLRLADPRQIRNLQVVMLPPAMDADPWSGERAMVGPPAPVEPDGSFVTWPVAAGRYLLVVRLANAFELARVADVVVPDDGAVDDPRLVAIDVGKALRLVTVTSVLDGRTPDPFDQLCFAPAEGSMQWPQLALPSVAVSLRERPQQVWLPPGPFTVQALRGNARSPADGMLSQKVDLRDDRATVVLSK